MVVEFEICSNASYRKFCFHEYAQMHDNSPPPVDQTLQNFTTEVTLSSNIYTLSYDI